MRMDRSAAGRPPVPLGRCLWRLWCNTHRLPGRHEFRRSNGRCIEASETTPKVDDFPRIGVSPRLNEACVGGRVRGLRFWRDGVALACRAYRRRVVARMMRGSPRCPGRLTVECVGSRPFCSQRHPGGEGVVLSLVGVFF